MSLSLLQGNAKSREPAFGRIIAAGDRRVHAAATELLNGA
jgi:hypothetical protein